MTIGKERKAKKDSKGTKNGFKTTTKNVNWIWRERERKNL